MAIKTNLLKISIRFVQIQKKGFRFKSLKPFAAFALPSGLEPETL